MGQLERIGPGDASNLIPFIEYNKLILSLEW